MLNAKALEVRDALLEAIVSKAREQNNDIISRYEAILSRIAEKPTNEADLAALRSFILDSKEKVLPPLRVWLLASATNIFLSKRGAV